MSPRAHWQSLRAPAPSSPPMDEARRQRVRQLLLSPLPLFILLSAFLFAIHEPWRDEAQPWLIVRDAPTLVAEMDSEGSPVLWYAMMAPLVKLGLPFWTMRVMHHLLAIGVVALLVYKGPFSRLETWLLSFGYFLAWEYHAVARSYVVLVLLLFLLAASWPRRLERPWLHAALLALLANVTGHGMLLAAILSASFGWDLLRARGLQPVAFLPLLVPALGGLFACWQMIPGPDLADWRTHSNWEWSTFHVHQAAVAVVHAFAPIPTSGPWVWHVTYLDRALASETLIPLAAAIWIAATLLLVHRPRVLLLWIASSSALLLVYYLKHGVSGQMRHHGILFATYLFHLWLARVDAPTTPTARAAPPPSDPGRASRLGPALVAVMLAVHVTATLPPVLADAREPFSGGKAAAAYLEEQGWTGPDTFLSVYPSFIAAPVLVHLDEDRLVYLPQVDGMGSYVRWTHEDIATFGMPVEEVVRRTLERAQETNATRVILLLSFPMWGDWFDPQWTLVHSTGSLSPGDPVHVYEMKCPPHGCPATG